MTGHPAHKTHLQDFILAECKVGIGKNGSSLLIVFGVHQASEAVQPDRPKGERLKTYC